MLALRPFGLGYERLEPLGVAVRADDPLTIYVSVVWREDGMCPDDARPIVNERRDRVIIKRVEPGSRVYGRASLKAPLGDGPVIRASDQKPLAVSTIDPP